MKREHIRPLVHAGALGFVFLEPVLGRWGMAATAFVAFLLNAFLLPRTAFGKMLRRPGDPWFNGQLSYPLALAIAYLAFHPFVAGVAWAVMALGDPAAALVGSSGAWSARLPWNRRKSVAGTLAFLAAAEIAAFCFLAASVPHAGTHDYLMLCIHVASILAVVGAVVETLPLPIDDNIPITLAVGGTLTWLSRLL